MARCAWSRWTRWSRCACIWWTRCVRSRWDGCAAWTSASSWPWPTASCTDTNLWRETDNHMMQNTFLLPLFKIVTCFWPWPLPRQALLEVLWKQTQHIQKSHFTIWCAICLVTWPLDATRFVLSLNRPTFVSMTTSMVWIIFASQGSLQIESLNSWGVLSNFVRKNWDRYSKTTWGIFGVHPRAQFISELYLSQADPPRLNMCIVSNFMHLAASTDSSFRGQWYHLIVTRN